MLYVLSVAEKLSPTDQHPRRRGFRSQITVWLKREDIEVEIKRLNKAVSKLYIQFTVSTNDTRKTILLMEHKDTIGCSNRTYLCPD
jgi:hypothetical protein